MLTARASAPVHHGNHEWSWCNPLVNATFVPTPSVIRAIALDLKKHSWDGRVTPIMRLRHVTRLGVVSEVEGSVDQWRQLQHITSQLPKLNTLGHLSYTCAPPGTFISSLSSLASLTRLDIQIGHGCNPFPNCKGVQLPGLRAASFAKCYDLADIVAFAPNLEHLYCAQLKVGGGRPAALETCTHFAGEYLDITSDTEPAQAFAAAFPNLQVVTYMPFVAHRAAGQAFKRLSAQELLARLPSVREGMCHLSVRGWSRRVMPKAAAAGPPELPELQRLCLHGPNVLDVESISSMTQLQHVRITFGNEGDVANSEAGTKVQELARELMSLPQLQSLLLPAGVLCSECCPGVQSNLIALTAKSSLKQLVFMEWQQPSNGMCETGFRCTHPEAVQAGLQSVAAAAAAAASTQKLRSQQQQQQQQLVILHHHHHRHAMPAPCEANPDSAAGVWGVYGPPGEW